MTASGEMVASSGTTPNAMMDLGGGLVATVLPADWKQSCWHDGDSIQRFDMTEVPRIAIPRLHRPERAAWEAAYLAVVGNWLGRPLRALRVPVDPALATHNNRVRNHARRDMYRDMCLAGDRLPPIVVRPCGRGYDGRDCYFIMDGNHRWFAAQDAGVKWLDAVVVADTELGAGWA